MIFVSLFLISIVAADECGNICTSVTPNPCSEKGSYCKNKHACMDLFWQDKAAGTMCNHKVAGCLIKQPVLCSEAVSSATAKSSTEKATPKSAAQETPKLAAQETAKPAKPAVSALAVMSVRHGMFNVRASCYFNAAVQALVHIPELREGISLLPVRTPLERRLKAMWDQMASDGTEPVDPRPLMREFAAVFGDGFDPKVSSDAAQVMRALIETLADTMLFEFETVETRPCPHCEALNVSPIVTRAHEVYFPVEVRASTGPVALSILLEAHFGGRDIPNMGCRVCDVRNNVAASIIRINPSPLLVMTLARFQADGSKLQTPVLIPMELDVSRFAPVGEDWGSSHYELVSIVHHHGGHFITEYKEDEQWFRANDSVVEPISDPLLAGSTPYIVVYKARH